MEENRFEKRMKQTLGFAETVEILVDRATGVQYVFRRDGPAGGLSVLLGADGKPLLAEWGTNGK